MPDKPVAIVGPTATGKSWLGLELAVRLEGEIVSADALQAYRGFDIGTAKPTPEERRRVRHHLVDVLEPHEPYSAGEFARRGRAALDEIAVRDRRALIVGGSGLYLRALLKGMSPIPVTDSKVRSRLRQELEESGLESLWARLLDRDPATASRLEEGDTQRVLRALEVLDSTGRPLSSWLEEDPAGEGPIEVVEIGLTLPRSVLYDRISERVGTMIQAGWVEEVADLLRKGVGPELPAFQAIGYRELAAHLSGRETLDAAIEATIRATRRYAKRQMTWFRREPAIRWFSIEDPASCLEEVVAYLNG